MGRVVLPPGLEGMKCWVLKKTPRQFLNEKAVRRREKGQQ